MDDPANGKTRSQTRQFVALILISAATALALGMTVGMKSQLGANDISRWCTVWSLLEKGTYAIDDCPWQSQTQDKVKKPSKLGPPGPKASAVQKFEYAIAPKTWKEGEPEDHFYSSKPPLLPTLIAGVLYPFRAATGVRLGRVAEQERLPRNVQKEDGSFVRETPKEPHKWPVYVFYFKPVIVLLNVVPMLVFLILFARLLDRYAANDWAWFLSLAAAAGGTLLLSFAQTLNNHTVAAWCAFFALYAFIRIWDEGGRSPWLFLSAGFFGAFCACNELPAALFGLVLFLLLVVRFPRRTLLVFVPAAAVPCIAFLATQYLAFGQFKPVYEEFGTKSYNYEGSVWNTPLEMDWFTPHPELKPDGTVMTDPKGKVVMTPTEPKIVYLFHMTFGHHGVFSLSPIFLFSIYGALGLIAARGGRLKAVSWLTLLLTIAMVAFYAWNPKARNYGGSTSGLRWLFWLIPFWLITLPRGVEAGQDWRGVRWLSLLALAVSVFTVGYALRTPWSHPWLLDAMEHLNLYTLKR